MLDWISKDYSILTSNDAILRYKVPRFKDSKILNGVNLQ
jgi:hypothetical protein